MWDLWRAVENTTRLREESGKLKRYQTNKQINKSALTEICALFPFLENSHMGASLAEAGPFWRDPEKKEKEKKMMNILHLHRLQLNPLKNPFHVSTLLCSKWSKEVYEM